MIKLFFHMLKFFNVTQLCFYYILRTLHWVTLFVYFVCTVSFYNSFSSFSLYSLIYMISPLLFSPFNFRILYYIVIAFIFWNESNFFLIFWRFFIDYEQIESIFFSLLIMMKFFQIELELNLFPINILTIIWFFNIC